MSNIYLKDYNCFIFHEYSAIKQKYPNRIQFLVGYLMGNQTILSGFMLFITAENAVKSTISLQIKLVVYSHSTVAGGLLVMS